MSRGLSPVKAQQWKQRFQRYRTSSLTVAQFCQAEGVSQPSFYQWRKKLAQHVTKSTRAVAAQSSAQASDRKSTFQSIQLVPTAVQKPTVTIRTLGGIKIEIVENLSVIQAVLEQLLRDPKQAGLGQGNAAC